MKHSKFFSLAKKEAKKSTHSRFNLGCVIVKKNKVLIGGYNKNKTSPTWGSGNYLYIHAETHALCQAKNLGIDITGATMYIYRKNGRLSKPCPECMKYLKVSGLKKVMFTDNDNKFATIYL